MKTKLTNNLALKILSVISAMLLWLIVANEVDPVRTETYTGIRVSMLNENAITSKGKVYKIEDESDVISVTVSAKRSVHRNLTSADFIATADMEKDIQFDNLIAIHVTCTNRYVNASDIKKSRNNVKVSIEDSATEEFNVVVKSRGTPGSGYVVGEMIPEQRVIKVTGPASIIERIKRIEAEVDVTGRTADDTVVCNLNVLNTDGDQLDTTYLQYNGKSSGMAVKINMLKTKEVSLRFGVSGTVGIGAVYRGISFKPETIEIAGTVEALQGLTSINIPDEAVNIDGFTETQTVEISLSQYLPENIRLVDEAADGIAVVMVEIEKMQTMDVTIPISQVALTGIPRGYSVDFGELTEVSLGISGLQEDLEELNRDDIIAILRVSGSNKPGMYTGRLEIHTPEKYHVDGEVSVEYELLKGNSGLGNSQLPDLDTEDTDQNETGSGGSTGSTGENGGNTGSASGSGTGSTDGSGSGTGGAGENGGSGGSADGSGTESTGGSTGGTGGSGGSSTGSTGGSGSDRESTGESADGNRSSDSRTGENADKSGAEIVG